MPCKRSLWAVVAALAVSAGARAAAEPTVIPLWPGTPPGEKGNIAAETRTEPRPGEKPALTRITNVTKPTITVYHPDHPNGTAIVIAPGGGYRLLAWQHEGTQVAEWLRSLGVTAVLLKYRVPRRPDQPQDQPPVGALQDAQRAISYTRAHAKEWHLDPHRIGMLGFSAGGHLTAWAATNFNKRAYQPVDDADNASCRPDFAIPIYPGGVLAKGSKDQLAPEIRVNKQTPPCFLVVAYNDTGSFGSTLALLKALKGAGVPAELHVYATGGHGFGMRPGKQPYATWTKRCEDWLRAEGLLGDAKK